MNYPLFALGLGFLLGLKHATEADHLIAVTTIVSEQRSIARAAPDSRAPSHERHGALGGWRPVVVGVVHGLAGSAALTLLVLTEVLRNGSRALGLAYLLIFGVGSIGGMMLMSALISLPFVFTASRFTRVDAPVRLLTGLLSVAFGIYYAWETAGGL